MKPIDSVLILISIAATLIAAHAQLVPDGGMITINGTPTNITGNLVVGTNGFWTNGLYTTLTITNAGAVTNTGNGTIGLNANAAFNQVIVAGTNSVWSNGGNANIGSSGPLNRLIVQGGRVENDFGNIGLNAGSRDNAVLVSGTGSVWANNNNVNVGNVGASNQLIVSSGGKVTSNAGRVGGSIDASNNLAVVMDPNSVWINSAELTVGSDGSYNALVVTNGGKVSNTIGSIGLNSNSGHNWAVVMGPGALWTNSSDLFVGKFSSANDLLVVSGGVVANRKGTIGETNSDSNRVIVSGGMWTNSSNVIVGNAGAANQLQVIGGGTVAAQNLYLGLDLSSSDNRVSVGNSEIIVTGPIHDVSLVYGPGNLIVTNSTASGVIDLRSGTLTLYSGLVRTDFLVLTNGPAGQIAIDGGTLIVRGGMISNLLPFSVGSTFSSITASTPAALDVRSNQPFVLNDSFILGSNVPNCQLFITNGGILKALGPSSYIGRESISTNSLALVANPNSLWTNASTLAVGYNGSSAQLVVSNRGRVVSYVGALGYNAGSSNNMAVVTGTNSLWTNSNSLIAGNGGSFNKLVVTNGGTAADDFGLVGSRAGSSGNQALVTGPGSLWANRSELYIGNVGSFNQLLVTNGARVTDTNGYLAYNFASKSNQVVVTGTNSLWTHAGTLYVGYAGARNNLVVENGARLQDIYGFIGDDVGADYNAVVVADAGSLWTNSQSITIGNVASFNQLIVSNGAYVVNGGDGSIGDSIVQISPAADRATLANYNSVVVTGPGSRWTNGADLYLGRGGSLNQLVVTNAGVVGNSGGDVYVGYAANGSNNLLTIAGANSIFANAPGSHTLRIGHNGSLNQLLVTNGGTLVDASAVLGVNYGSSDNLAVVTGAGSVWTNSGTLTIGSNGAANQMVVTNGGLVLAGDGTIGFTTNSDDNLAVVTGSNSRWVNQGPLYVGYGGSFNELDLDNAGAATAPTLYLGFTAASTFNRVDLGGGNLYVTNSSGSGVTDVRRGTLALNAGLLQTDNLLLTNGAQSVLDFNEGTLRTRNTTCNNGAQFSVGTGGNNKSGALELLGDGTHVFAQGLAVNRNSTLKGTGTVIGNVTVDRGTVSPGASIGRLTILGSLTYPPSTSTTNFFELNKTLGTNDTIAGLTSVTYGGRLVVTNLGGSLTNGDAFQLFSATNYAGAFSSISPSSPGDGLRWVTNRLVIDGTLRVASIVNTLVISSSFFANGTNFVINASGGVPNIPVYLFTATNLISTNWSLLATRAFDASGNATFTNTVTPSEPQRYFRLLMDCATFDCF